MRAAAALLGVVAVAAAAQEPAPLARAELQLLSDVVRHIHNDFARRSDDAVLASGCAQELAALTGATTRAARTLEALPGLLLEARTASAGRIADRRLAAVCIEGMVATLDSHSQFLDEEATRELYFGSPGGAAGTGLELRRDGDDLVVVDVFENAPAARAGVRPGDVIARIDGVPTGPLPLRESVTRLRGAVGSVVTLQLRRAGSGAAVDVPVTRELVRLQTLRAAWQEGDLLELRISRFTEGTRAELQREAVRLAAERGREPRGVILDLRANSGGLLTAAIEVSGLFLPDGAPVGSTRGRGGRLVKAYRANETDAASRFAPRAPSMPPALAEALRKAPLAVLVSRRTASGAEILSAALQGNGRAVLAGERTLGMGSIQTLFPLGAAGRSASLKLTTNTWTGPKDAELDGRPLEPDLPVPEAAALERARRWFAEAAGR